MSATEAYHLEELRIARDATHPKHNLPTLLERPRRILDVGCGAGQTLIGSGAATRCACGIDPDAQALKLGRRLDDRLQLALARGEQLPYRDGAFDLVISRVALPYMRIDRALAEMARVLVPGGDAWITLHPIAMTWREVRADLRAAAAKNLVHRAYVLANGALLHFTGREFAMPWRRDAYESFQTERTMRRALERAGFRDVAFERKNAFVATARRR